jgi:electron transport complex protein RnfG
MTNSNKETPEEQEMTIAQSILKNSIGLAIFAFITAGVIAITQQTTAERIDFNIAEAQAKALYEITPKETVDNDILNDSVSLLSSTGNAFNNLQLLGPIDKKSKIFFAKLNGNTHTLIYPTIAPDGYTAAIKLLIGIKSDGSIAGVRIVDHKETPGLGDKVELKKSNWVLSFEGKSLNIPVIEKWKVKKDGGEFDQFTGATITPRAVVNAIRNTLVFHQENYDTILNLKNKSDQINLQTEAKTQ